MEEERPKRMALIASQGTLDLAGLSPLYFGINRSCDGNAGGSIFYFLWTDPAQTKNHCKGCPPRQSCDADENALRAKKFPELRMADAQYVDGKPSGIWDHSHFTDEADL